MQTMKLDEWQIAAWKMADEAERAKDRKLKQSAKVASSEAVLDVLAPLREIYWASDAMSRRAIELTVLDYLRRRRT